MKIEIITIFPGLFEAFLAESFVGIAASRGLIEAAAHDLRDWTTDRHRSVDDQPYGGGPGMVMTPEPLVSAIEALAGPRGVERTARVVALTPQGAPLDQQGLERLAGLSHLVLVCGRYEGFDQRAIDLAVDEELSIGDYVVSGGEIPAMVVIEGLVRLLPGVLGNPASVVTESFREDLLEGPHYTRPPVFRGLDVPGVLRSGDHAAIELWRSEQAKAVTAARRPDLLERSRRLESKPEGQGEEER